MPTKKPIKFNVILSTCPSPRVARHIAAALIDERLAACVNILPTVHSVYRWKGKRETTREVLLVIKARAGNYWRIESRICALHPYELPEILALPVTGGHKPYLDWLDRPEPVR